MSRRERDKGLAGEREVRAIYEAYGFAVRGLEGVGDHLVVGHGLVIHSEVKRQEVLRLPLWTRQAWSEAPAGAVPILAYRRSRQPWRALVPDESVGLTLFCSPEHVAGGLRTRELNGRLWIESELEHLLAGLVAARRALGLVGATL